MRLLPKIPLPLGTREKLEPNIRSIIGTIEQTWEKLALLLNGRVTFGDGTNADNIAGYWYNATTPGVANTDFTVNHGLGRIPSGYLVVSKSATCDVYTGSVAATPSAITLRATVAGVTVRIFVL